MRYDGHSYLGNLNLKCLIFGNENLCAPQYITTILCDNSGLIDSTVSFQPQAFRLLFLLFWRICYLEGIKWLNDIGDIIPRSIERELTSCRFLVFLVPSTLDWRNLKTQLPSVISDLWLRKTIAEKKKHTSLWCYHCSSLEAALRALWQNYSWLAKSREMRQRVKQAGDGPLPRETRKASFTRLPTNVTFPCWKMTGP